jgi:uncharacterized protein (DUF427 family)
VQQPRAQEDRDGACDMERRGAGRDQPPRALEGNVYFPPEDVRQESPAGGLVNRNAAWYYPHPSLLARKIRNHVAFWNEVLVDAETGMPSRAAG